MALAPGGTFANTKAVVTDIPVKRVSIIVSAESLREAPAPPTADTFNIVRNIKPQYVLTKWRGTFTEPFTVGGSATTLTMQIADQNVDLLPSSSMLLVPAGFQAVGQAGLSGRVRATDIIAIIACDTSLADVATGSVTLEFEFLDTAAVNGQFSDYNDVGDY